MDADLFYKEIGEKIERAERIVDRVLRGDPSVSEMEAEAATAFLVRYEVPFHLAQKYGMPPESWPSFAEEVNAALAIDEALEPTLDQQRLAIVREVILRMQRGEPVSDGDREQAMKLLKALRDSIGPTA